MSCGCSGNISLNSFGCCCQCGELPAVREEGPPGPAGPDGGVPVFEVGTVTTGSPSVTITQVTPLLYTIDFVLPAAPTSTPNTWSDTQTFTVEAIFNGGLTSNGNVDIVGDLAVSGNAALTDVTVSGSFATNGTATVDSLAVLNDAAVAGNFSVTGTTTFIGAVTFTVTPDLGIAALTASENTRGFLVLDHNNVIKYVSGQGFTRRFQTLGTTLTDLGPLDVGIKICDTLVVNVPVLTPNQPTPLLDIEATIMYEGGGSTDDLTFSLWNGTIGVGSALEFWDIGIPGNESKQCTIRVCQAQLALGNNNFNLSGDNNSAAATITITKVVWRYRP